MSLDSSSINVVQVKGDSMNKHTFKKWGHTFYLLGVDVDGIKYYLQEAKWDCDWYWGGGYVETFSNNRNPVCSRDINSHNHFDLMFFNSNKNGFDMFKGFFKETPFTDNEIWKICELMNSFYIAREYSDMIYRGGANYTQNPAKETIKNETEYTRINKVMIPTIMTELYKILEDKGE